MDTVLILKGLISPFKMLHQEYSHESSPDMSWYAFDMSWYDYFYHRKLCSVNFSNSLYNFYIDAHARARLSYIKYMFTTASILAPTCP